MVIWCSDNTSSYRHTNKPVEGHLACSTHKGLLSNKNVRSISRWFCLGE